MSSLRKSLLISDLSGSLCRSPIFLWSPMPNFQQQLDGHLRGNNSSIPPSNEREEKFYELLKKFKVPQNLSIIQTSNMWCSSTELVGCVSFSDNDVLMADEGHLGVEGAKVFGQHVINNSTLKSHFGK